MYNGIGLQTARGSGTNGYVQKNLAYLKPRDAPLTLKEETKISLRNRSPDRDILEHERKRKVEIAVMELRDDLEEKGVDEAEIVKQEDDLRKKLLSSMSATSDNNIDDIKSLHGYERHTLAAAKDIEMKKLDKAFDTKSSYVEGQAFDRELQERKKIERLQERDRRQLERVERQKQRQMRDDQRKFENNRRGRNDLPSGYRRSRSPVRRDDSSPNSRPSNYSDSRSPSPSRRYRSPSSSISPPRRTRRSYSRSLTP